MCKKCAEKCLNMEKIKIHEHRHFSEATQNAKNHDRRMFLASIGKASLKKCLKLYILEWNPNPEHLTQQRLNYEARKKCELYSRYAIASKTSI